MNNHFKYRSVFIVLLSVMILGFGSQNLFAQKVKKNKVRLNVEYVKVMDGEVYFNIKASSRINRKTLKIADIEITVFNELESEDITLGTTTTNMNGESKFKLKSLNAIIPDSSKTYNMSFSFKGNDTLNKVKKSISFKDAKINAKIISKDSINYIIATLEDVGTNPLVDQSLVVQVQRLFKPLKIGEEFNITDDTGSIKVEIENGIPGVDGNLSIEVVLEESDDYGTVIAVASGNVGIPIVDESTFDQRTMWSPRNKTPIFLLIFPNLLILGVWGLIVYLIINLFKLSKS